jgi:hypothetical protein
MFGIRDFANKSYQGGEAPALTTAKMCGIPDLFFFSAIL